MTRAENARRRNNHRLRQPSRPPFAVIRGAVCGNVTRLCQVNGSRRTRLRTSNVQFSQTTTARTPLKYDVLHRSTASGASQSFFETLLGARRVAL
jgi:hypothetical protein